MEAPFTRPYIDSETGQTVMLTDAQKAVDLEGRYREIRPGQAVSAAISDLGDAIDAALGFEQAMETVEPRADAYQIRGVDRSTGRALD